MSVVQEKCLPIATLSERILDCNFLKCDDFKAQKQLQQFANELAIGNMSNLLQYAELLLIYSNEPELINETFELWLATGPLNAKGFYFYALFMEYEMKNISKAKLLLEQSTQYNPNNPITWRKLSSLIRDHLQDAKTSTDILERYRELKITPFLDYLPITINFCTKYIATSPLACKFLATVTKKWMKKDFYDKRFENTTISKYLHLQSIQLKNDDYSVHFNLGLIYELLDDFAHAKYHYEQSIKYNDQNADAIFNLGCIWLEQYSNFEKSLEYNLRAVQIQPCSAFHLNLGICWQIFAPRDKIDPRKAKEHFLKAIEFDFAGKPELKLTYRDSLHFLGITCFELEEYEEGFNHLSRAILYSDNFKKMNQSFSVLQQHILDLADESSEWRMHVKNFEKLRRIRLTRYPRDNVSRTEDTVEPDSEPELQRKTFDKIFESSEMELKAKRSYHEMARLWYSLPISFRRFAFYDEAVKPFVDRLWKKAQSHKVATTKLLCRKFPDVIAEVIAEYLTGTTSKRIPDCDDDD